MSVSPLLMAFCLRAFHNIKRIRIPNICGAAVKYINPPVVETVLSVQFKPLASFGAGQLGAFWTELGDDWPHVVDAPAVDPVFERFEAGRTWEAAAFGFTLSQQIDVRLQIRNQVKNRMIQIQNGRFFYNWLGTPGTDYPSYESVRPEFDEQWERFRAFVVTRSDENAVQPNQWEVLYVNHIPQATVWSKLSDLPNVFTFLRPADLSGLSLSADGFGGEWRFEIEPKKGRLYVKLGMKRKADEGTPFIVMTLIARGPVGNETFSLDEGLELGHKTITDSFDRLTSTNAQKYWGVQNADK